MAYVDTIEGIERKGLTSLVIQGLLLSANIAFFINDKGNIYMVISVLFLISLFVLQSINRRFLFLHPVNNFMNEFVSFADTKILKCFIMISAIFLFVGTYDLIFKPKNQPLVYRLIGENCTIILVYIIAGLVLIVLPVCWEIWFAGEVKKKIITKLKNQSYTFLGKCPFCGGSADIERKVNSDGKGSELIKCHGNCTSKNKADQIEFEKKDINLMIGFVEGKQKEEKE